VTELHVYQSLWAMERLPMNAAHPWSIVEQLDRIAAAGFRGVGVEFLPDPPADVCALACERGLRIIVLAFPRTVDELRPVLAGVDRVGREHVDHVNLQPNVRPHTVAACLPYLHGWQALAAAAGITVNVETHRDRMTTDLFFVLDLLECFPDLRLLGDLSHFLVGREFATPIDDVNHAMIHRVLENCWAFHGRVASREQVQIEISFPHHKMWLDIFLGWWEYGFRSWRKRSAADAEVTFTCELGPKPYSITGRDGNDTTDRWAEALMMRDRVREIWERSSR